jgi:hypothetical protein
MDKNNLMTRTGYITSPGEGEKLNNFAVEPKMYVDETPRTGFTEYAELLNGRLAAIGFVALIAMEVLTGHGIFGYLTGLGQ